MRNLIPKAISKNKITVWRNIGIVDILIIAGWISLMALFIFGLDIANWIKILCIVLISIFSLPLIIEVNVGVKGWKALYLFFKHLFVVKKYKINTRNDTALLVPYQKVEDDELIKTYGGFYVGGFEVKGFDITLNSNQEQEKWFSNLQNAFKHANFPFSIIKLERPLDFNATIAFYQEQLAKLNKVNNKNNLAFQNRKKLLENSIKQLKTTLIENGNKTQKHFYVFGYDRNKNLLKENLKSLISSLVMANLVGFELNSYELTNILHLIWNPYQKPISQKEFIEHKDELAQLLSFDSFNLKKNYFKANDLFYSIHNVYDYHFLIKDLWAAELANNEQTIVFNVWPLDRESSKEALNKALNNTRTRLVMAKSNVIRNELEYEINAYQQLIDNINGANETLKNVDVLFLNYGTSYQRLKMSEKLLKKELSSLEMKVNNLAYRQLEGLASLLPNLYEPLINKYGREIPSATLGASFPFLNSGICDEKGQYLGVNYYNEPIVFDLFKLDKKRKNHNMAIFGLSGSGKSFTLKKLISFHLQMQRNVIVIDPEREYQKLCNNFGGQWIDTGDALLGKINPLQILDNSFKDEKEKNENSAPLSNHLRLLMHWVKTLYHDFSGRELSVLNKFLMQLYAKWNITNETNLGELNAKQFPIINDLIELLKNSYQANKDKLVLEFINLLETDFGINGKYEKLWNGYTTLNFVNQLVVYDVLTLFEQDEPKVIAAQLYLVLAFIKQEVKKNRFINQNEIVIIVDEAHLAIDKDNPVALNFMYQMAKRIRKYKGGLIVATQNLKDFFGSEQVIKKTTAIINNTQYSMIFNLAPQDLEDIQKLYRSYGGFTTNEVDYIARANTGQALLIVSGYERHCMQIQSSTLEMELAGSK